MNNYDPTDIVGQREAKREDAARKKAARKAQDADLKWLMSSPRGRRIMWRLLDMSGPFKISFDTNALKMAFAEGMRNLGNQLFAEVMDLCPELYPVMAEEQKNGCDDGGDGDKSN